MLVLVGVSTLGIFTERGPITACTYKLVHPPGADEVAFVRQPEIQESKAPVLVGNAAVLLDV